MRGSESPPRRRRMPRRSPPPRRRISRSRSYEKRRPISSGKRKKPKSFKEFMLKLPDSVTPEEAQKEYKTYVERFDKSQEAIFTKEHKDEEWFQERYDPVLLEQVLQKRAGDGQEHAKQFVEDYLGDKLNDIVQKDIIKEPEKDDILEKAEVVTGSMDILVDTPEKSNDDDDANDVEMSEEKPEEKKEDDNTEMETKMETEETEEIEKTETEEKPEGMKMKKPGEYRPKLEFKGPQSDRYTERLDEKPPEELYFEDNTVFISNLPLKIGRKKLLELFSDRKGFIKLRLSSPIKNPRQVQVGWAEFDSQENCREVMKEESKGGLNGKRLDGSNYLGLLPKTKSRQRRPYFVREIFLHSDRIKSDVQQALALITKFDKEAKIHEHHIFSAENLDNLQEDLQRLNLAIAYLRKVHLYCYYQGERFLTAELLHNKYPIIGGKAYIRQRGEASECERPEEPYGCERTVDDAYHDEMDEEREIFKENTWEERKRLKLATDNTVEVKANKFRCALCQKAFKGPTYVKKHIALKHGPIVDLYVEKERENETVVNYSKDRSKVTAMRFQTHEERFNNRRFGGRGFPSRYGHRGFRPRSGYRGRGHFNSGTRKLEPSHPTNFERSSVGIVRTEEKIKTVKNYSGVADDLAVDDLLDFGFGEFEKAPKFNL